MLFILTVTALALVVFFVYTFFDFSKLFANVGKFEKMIKENKNYDGAARGLEKILKRNPRHIKAHFLLAEASFYLKNYAQAIAEYNQVIQLGHYDKLTDDSYLHQRLADIYIERGDVDLAEKELLDLLITDPQNTDVQLQLGNLFFKPENKKLLERAVKYFQKINDSFPGIAESAEKLMTSAWLLEDFSRCAKTADNTLSIQPENPSANYYKGLLFMRDNDYYHAIECLQKGAKSKTLFSSVQLKLGICNIHINRFSEAEELFRIYDKLPAKTMDDEVAFDYYQGLLHEKNKNVIDAVKCWTKVCAINNEYMDVQERLQKYQAAVDVEIIKEILVGNAEEFKKTVFSTLERMDFQLTDAALQGNNVLISTAVKMSNKIIADNNTKNSLIYFSRADTLITDTVISSILTLMKQRHAFSCYCFTFSPVRTDAAELAQARGIQIFEKDQIINFLKKL